MSVEKQTPRKVIIVLRPNGKAYKFILEDVAADEPVFAIVAEDSDKILCTTNEGDSLTLGVEELMGKKITGIGQVYVKLKKEGGFIKEVALSA